MYIMLIGVVGKSNVGKTSFFSAATLVDAEISNRIFTTIEPNRGVTYVRTPCPCSALKVKCSPRNSRCVNGVRYVPVKMVDVAGLVPDAHRGKGLGNQFLSDIMEADALIHVVDIAGATDESGNPVSPGTRDPKDDIKFLEEEIDYWILGIVKKNFSTSARRMEAARENFTEMLHRQLTGLGIKLQDVEEAVLKTGITPQSDDFALLEFIEILRKKSKPILLAANKIDIAAANDNFERITEIGYRLFACSAASELALRRAAEKGIIKYMPGDRDFEIAGAVDEKQKTALDFIKKNVLERYGSTGVQNVIDTAVFSVLDLIVVYPVENEHKFSDKKGNVLPDAFLIKKGSKAVDLAFKVHQDIGKNFIAAIDARTGRQLSADYLLKDGDVISIRAGK
jgi:ribosome-binding ATPase